MRVEPTEFATPDEVYEKNNFTRRVATGKEQLTVAGQQAIRYSLSWESMHTVNTILVRDGKAYTLVMDYAYDTGKEKYFNEYEAFVKSFKFN